MITIDPKICIVFNSGAAGDFLASIIAAQYNEDTSFQLDIDSNGMCCQPPGNAFKQACKEFYKKSFDSQVFANIQDEPIVNTHYCFQQLIDLFPNCKFYYIDDTDHVQTTVDTYIQKRITNVESLIDWLHRTNTFEQIGKISKITDDQIKQVMYNDWHKCLHTWKKLNISRIDIRDIVDETRCCELVKSIVKLKFNQLLFSEMYNVWETGNRELITKILWQKNIT